MSKRELRIDRVAAVIGGSLALIAIIVLIVWALASQTPATAV